MTIAIGQPWEARRTEETRHVESFLTEAGFDRVDAYRFNSAAIRVRVIDPRFEGRSPTRRDAMVERHLSRLPEHTQADILQLFTFAPSELQQVPKPSRQTIENFEFEDPSPSTL